LAMVITTAREENRECCAAVGPATRTVRLSQPSGYLGHILA